MNALRHAYGLRWQTERIAARDLAEWRGALAGLVVILLIAGLVHTADYAEQQRADAERMARLATARTAQLAACLNGELRMTTADGHGAVVCADPAMWIDWKGPGK